MDLTPVERHGGYLVKRDDTFEVDGSRGGKVRTCLALLTGLPADCPGVVTAGARHSPQVQIVATVAQKLGLPCRAHVPAGDPTPELLSALDRGAELRFHRPGYNNVLTKRARDDAAESGRFLVPFGMECQTAVDQTAAQCANLPYGQFERVVVSLGSGMSAAGILEGTATASLPVLGVAVGADALPRLRRWSGRTARVSVVRSELAYNKRPAVMRLGDLELDPVYEAKCLPFLRDGDLFWVVGRRA